MIFVSAFLYILTALSGFIFSKECGIRTDIAVVNHRDNSTIIILPAAFDSSKPYPLLIALHGRGGKAKDMANLFEYYREEPVIVAVPQGPFPAEGKSGYSWFYLTRDRSQWAYADSISVEYILAVIRDSKKRYRISRTCVMGFSQGASLAYMTGLKNPNIIDGIIAVAGIMPEVDKFGSLITQHDIQRAYCVRMLIARGKSDSMVSRTHFSNQKTFFSLNGFPVTDFEFNSGHTLTKELMDFIFAWIKAGIQNE